MATVCAWIWNRRLMIGGVVGTFLTISGLAGLPDDLAKWADWLSWLKGDAGPWVFVAVGIAVLFLTFSNQMEMRLPSKTRPRPAAQRERGFDPHTISSELGGADFSGLFAADSYITFTLKVKNASGYAVKIKGVEGRIRCCGEECNAPATVEQAPRQLSTLPRDRVPCVIRQGVSEGMMQVIQRKGVWGPGRLTFSLSALRWTGAVSLPEGSADLENCYAFQQHLVVQGPIREKGDGSTLFLLAPRFLSSKWYSSDGQPKQDT